MATTIAHVPAVPRRTRHTAAYRRNKLAKEVGFWALLGVFLLFAAFPVYWMFITAFKQVNDLYNLQNDPFVFNLAPTLDQVRYLFEHTPYAQWLRNTVEVGLLVVVVTVVICVPAAYVLARTNFPGSGTLGIGIFLTYLIPPTLLFLPLSQIVVGLGLVNTRWALVVVYPTFTIPFCTWLLMGFFRSIPPDLEDAAMVDGASRIEAFRRIVLPLAAPGVLAAALFAFTLAWNEFLYALVFIHDTELKTIPVGLNDLMFGDIFLWGQLMAASVLTTVPVVVLYTYLQRYMVEGLTAGAVKG